MMSSYQKRSAVRWAAAGIAVFAAAVVISLSGCSTTINVPTNRHALVIGIANYQNATDLTYTVNDAQDMQTTLLDTGWTDAAILTNSSATKAGIASAIQTLASQAASDPDPENSTILVYFSGHGDTESSVSYICPYDTSFIGSTPDVNSMISVSELYKMLEQATCRNKLLILDSCYSGGFIDTGSSIDVSPQDVISSGTNDASVLFSALAKANILLAESCSAQADPSITTISACGSEEESYDAEEYANGAFTHYLLEAASKADSSGKGYVTVSEAYSYTKKLLKFDWDTRPHKAGSSLYWELLLPHISGGAGDLVLFVNQ